MKIIATTHSGKFHADDVLAWALIQYFYDPNITLVRSRDPKIIEQSAIVFDEVASRC